MPLSLEEKEKIKKFFLEIHQANSGTPAARQAKGNKILSEEFHKNYLLFVTNQKDFEQQNVKIVKLLNAARIKTIQSNRSYIPQQYAGIASYSDTETGRYLVATSDMAPCVGLVFYCEDTKKAMIAHFDSDFYSNKQPTDTQKIKAAELKAYIQQLAIQLHHDTSKILATIVAPSSMAHDGLDNKISEILAQLNIIQKPNQDSSAVVCDVSNGNILCFDYGENVFAQLNTNAQLFLVNNKNDLTLIKQHTSDAVIICKEDQKAYFLKNGQLLEKSILIENYQDLVTNLDASKDNSGKITGVLSQKEIVKKLFLQANLIKELDINTAFNLRSKTTLFHMREGQLYKQDFTKICKIEKDIMVPSDFAQLDIYNEKFKEQGQEDSRGSSSTGLGSLEVSNQDVSGEPQSSTPPSKRRKLGK